FFFQAEDGIRDLIVTGVQTCALPIFRCPPWDLRAELAKTKADIEQLGAKLKMLRAGPRREEIDVARQSVETARSRLEKALRQFRSEERRVGKECRTGWWREHRKENRV